MSKTILLALACAGLVALASVSASAVVVYDTFTRPDGPALGTTEDALHVPWVKGAAADPNNMKISRNRLYLGGDDLVPGGAYLGGGYGVVDFDMSFSFQAAQGLYSNWYAFVLYRGAEATAGTEDYGAFNLEILGNGVIYLYTSATGHLAGVGTGIDFFAAPHTFRVKATGQQHDLWIDGLPIYSVTTPYMGGGGTITLGHRHLNCYYDSLSIEGEVIPEPATITCLAAGIAALVGRRRRR